MISILKGKAVAIASVIMLASATLSLAAPSAGAVEIQEVRTPGGITAWLVEDSTVPIVAMDFAFEGGSAVDPDDKRGLTRFLAATLDEGAGELTSQEFQRALERSATKLSFNAGRDQLFGKLQTLTTNRDEAFNLLKLAVNEPRFDAEAVERMRSQLVMAARDNEKNPQSIAFNEWLKLALGNHPYVNDPSGSVAGLEAVTVEDLRSLKDRVLNRKGLKIAVVGDIDAETLAPLLDEVFGSLPEDGDVPTVADAKVRSGAAIKVIDYNVPQSVIQFGRAGLKRNDPDFIPTYVMNHVLGGGGFGSRLVEEVREKRGLTYSVYSYLWPLDHVGLLIGGAATRNDRAADTVKVIQDEMKRMATEGPTERELEDTKKYLTGSYALRFDSNSKIARELLGIQLDDLGIDYINERNAMIEAVTLEDVREAAKRLLGSGDLLITVVGEPENLAGTEG